MTEHGLATRRSVALALAALALLVAVAFLVVGAACGAEQVTAVPPGEPMPEPTCVSAIHPFAWVLLGGAVLGFAGTWHRRRGVPLALGAAFLLLAFPLMFSAGPFVLLGGALLLVAGLVLTGRASRRAPAWLRPSTALAALALSVALAVLVLQGEDQVLWPEEASVGVSPALALVSGIFVAARRTVQAPVWTAMFLAWGLWRAYLNPFGEAFAPLLMAGAVAAMWWEGRGRA